MKEKIMNNNYITITEVNKYIKEIINEDIFLNKVYSYDKKKSYITLLDNR